jgi:DnaJ-domain-containing protein 1
MGNHPRRRSCDMPGCPGLGDHKAPKDRSLSDYYWFCFDHVQEYNKAWDFFSGMSPADIEKHIVDSMTGDRPTRRYDTMAGRAEDLRQKAWQTYNFTESEPPKQKTAPAVNTPEFEALAIMGLEPPVTLENIKAKYKQLAKKYHPDHNRTDPAAEELLKKINMAYTVLKVAYQKFEDLPARS